MSRIRTIKPDFCQNEKLSSLQSETHLLAAGLICYADDEGYFNANPKLVQAAIFPLRELLVSIPEMLRSLVSIQYIEIFLGTDDKTYGRIVKFLDHQRVSHPVPSKIKLLRDASGNIPEPYVSAPEVFRPELNRIELNRIEKVKSTVTKTVLPSLGEVNAYCQQRHEEGHPLVDAQQWFNHYTSNGWMVGRVKMKDWRAAVRTWERPENRGGNGNGAHNASRTEPSVQVKRAFNNIAAVAAVFGGSDSIPSGARSAAVDHPSLGDGPRQAPRSSPSQPSLLEGEVKRHS